MNTLKEIKKIISDDVFPNDKIWKDLNEVGRIHYLIEKIKTSREIIHRRGKKYYDSHSEIIKAKSRIKYYDNLEESRAKAREAMRKHREKKRLNKLESLKSNLKD